MYPEFTIAHMPSNSMQESEAEHWHTSKEIKDPSETEFNLPKENSRQNLKDSVSGQEDLKFYGHEDNHTRDIGKNMRSKDTKEFQGLAQNSENHKSALASRDKDENFVEPQNDSSQENQNGNSTEADCCNILANAPVFGDHYEYHVDADPLTLPESLWREEFGDYCNR